MAKAERRRNRRYAVEGLIVVEVPHSGPGVAVVDVSAGGFALATDKPLEGDGLQSFRFISKDQRWQAAFEARAVYFLLQPLDSGPHAGKVITGFQFAHAEEPTVRRRIEDLLVHAVGVVA